MKYLEELLQETVNFSHVELKKLADQGHKNIENRDSEEEQKELSTVFLKTSLVSILEICTNLLK